MMNNRKELTIKVPIISSEVCEFTSRDLVDQYHFLNIADQIFSFIGTHLSNQFEIGDYSTLRRCFTEIIKNAFDSFAVLPLIPNEFFILKTVIKVNNGNVLINIKDNGSGFIGLPKGKYFDRSQVKYQDKTQKPGYYGGGKIGLRLFESELKKIGSKMILKNRKETGASIQIELPAKSNLK